MTLCCELRLDHAGHQYLVRTRPADSDLTVVDFTVPGVAAMMSIAPQLAQGKRLMSVLKRCLPGQRLQVQLWLRKRRISSLDFQL